MLVYLNKNKSFILLLFIITAISFIAPEIALAQDGGDSNLAKKAVKELLKPYKIILDFVFLLGAVFAWFQFFQNIQPDNSVMTSVWRPAMITLFALKWMWILEKLGVF